MCNPPEEVREIMNNKSIGRETHSLPLGLRARKPIIRCNSGRTLTRHSFCLFLLPYPMLGTFILMAWYLAVAIDGG